MNNIYSVFLRYGAYAVMPTLQALMFLVLIRHYPGVVVSSAIRTYELVLFTILALLSLYVPKTWPLLGVVLFFVVNDQRVLTAAVTAAH